MTAPASFRDLSPIFAPRSVAVFGATEDRRKVGYRPLFLLQKFKWSGRIYPVTPSRDSVLGVKAYPALEALPEVPDLAIIAVPARDVPDLAEACAGAGVKAVVIYSSGFSEVDEAGAAAEARLRALASRTGMLIAGPNCQGLADFSTGMVSNFTTALMTAEVPVGPVALLAQSGLFGGMLLTACLQRGLGLRYLASTGNEAGFTLADAISYAALDPNVRVITGYVEEIRDFSAFRAAALAARAAGQTVLMLKVGDSSEGQRAAARHTGSYPGGADRYDGLFNETGVIRVNTLDELIAMTETFAKLPQQLSGRNVGILTNSGGLGVYSADVVAAKGLSLRPFGDDTTAYIRDRLLAFGSCSNPVDISTQAFIDPASVQECLDKICTDPDVHILSVTFGLQQMNGTAVARGIVDTAQKYPHMPFFVSWLYSDPEGEDIIRAAGLPVFFDPALALHCAGAFAQRASSH